MILDTIQPIFINFNIDNNDNIIKDLMDNIIEKIIHIQSNIYIKLFY